MSGSQRTTFKISYLVQCGSWALSSGHQAWQQVPLPTGPSHQRPHLPSSKLSQAVLAHPKVLETVSCLLVTVIFPSEYFYLASYCLFVIYLLSFRSLQA